MNSRIAAYNKMNPTIGLYTVLGISTIPPTNAAGILAQISGNK